MPSYPSAPSAPAVFINFWREGGMRHYAESVMQALGGEGNVVYLRNYPTETATPGLMLDLDLRPLRPANWLALARIVRLLLRLRPRAVHLNNEQPALLPLYPLLACWNSVITLHDARSHAGERPLKRIFHLFHLVLVRFFMRQIIVHSPAIRDALPAWLPRDRIHVVPHVNYHRWTSGPAPALADSPVTVLFFGRILPYKGLDTLLAAFALLDPSRFQLIIAGEGAVPPIEAPNIELENHFVSDDRLAALFHRAHLVALPYRAASQSGVAHMAFAFGKPVVATRVGALPEVVHHEVNGLLVPPDDAPALAAALERLADPQLRRCFAQAIRGENAGSDELVRALLLAIYHG